MKEYSTVIPVYVKLWAYLLYSNVKQSVWTNFLFSCCSTKLQSLLHNVLQAIHFAAMHDKWATANASTNHNKTLDGSVQQAQVVLKEFSDGKWREKCPAGLFKKMLCDDGETTRPQDDIVHASVQLEMWAATALCVAKLLLNLSFFERAVYVSRECCQIPTNVSITHIASWGNAKFGLSFGKSN